MNAVQISSKVIKGHTVSWMNNGRVYVSRDLFDKCANAEAIDFRANTPREFYAICDKLAA